MASCPRWRVRPRRSRSERALSSSPSHEAARHTASS
jgi:hypothetical protein